VYTFACHSHATRLPGLKVQTSVGVWKSWAQGLKTVTSAVSSMCSRDSHLHLKHIMLSSLWVRQSRIQLASCHMGCPPRHVASGTYLHYNINIRSLLRAVFIVRAGGSPNPKRSCYMPGPADRCEPGQVASSPTPPGRSLPIATEHWSVHPGKAKDCYSQCRQHASYNTQVTPLHHSPAVPALSMTQHCTMIHPDWYNQHMLN
jgi:hypothetical protein